MYCVSAVVRRSLPAASCCLLPASTFSSSSCRPETSNFFDFSLTFGETPLPPPNSLFCGQGWVAVFRYVLGNWWMVRTRFQRWKITMSACFHLLAGFWKSVLHKRAKKGGGCLFVILSGNYINVIYTVVSHSFMCIFYDIASICA